MKKSLSFYTNILAICLLCFFSGSNGLVNSSIQACIEQFSEVSASSIRLTTTLPSLISLPVMLLASHYVSKIGYRKSMIIATIFMTLGGIGPYFIHSSWSIVIMFRCLTGIGLGFYGLRNALILGSFNEDLQSRFIGIGNAMNSLASVILTPIAGLLCSISWRHPFLLFGIGFIVLILTILSLEEPQVFIEEKKEKTSFQHIFDLRYSIYITLYFIVSMVLYPILSGMSTYITVNNLGNAAIAGSVLSCHNIGGFIASFFINECMNTFKEKTAGLSFLIITIGLMFMLFIPNVYIMGLGNALTGVGFFILISCITVYSGKISDASQITMRSTLLLVSMQLGMFLSSYFMEWSHMIFKCSTDVESSWWACTLILAVCTLISFIFKNYLFNLKEEN